MNRTTGIVFVLAAICNIDFILLFTFALSAVDDAQLQLIQSVWAL